MDLAAKLIEPDQSLRPGYEPFEGYRLESQIGRGGFGEVWRVNAPGDLKKAIKFVFGHHDDSRASREMRSLERIRTIRHPFLLTLERFEIVNDRLVIVTELADGSLEDIYKRHRAAGSCGIPRASLLKNLSDTADGLDYLHQQFGLQHLDVKPANLLMVGGHVKIADFGLLKDLGDIDCSVVGGLTPIYAPPELFDGRPSLHSDQYSLAILYQEMLTGMRPFTGRTIAQLATQHVHSSPNLEPLPPRDRNIVARALEKDPNRRFESCEEFVNELSRTNQTSVCVIKDAKIVAKPKIGDLPAIKDCEGVSATTGSKILVVGLGGTGLDCIESLQRVAMATCTETTIDAVAIDVDFDSSLRIKMDEQYKSRFRFRNVHTPLRTATEYRRDAASRFATISRRWIYNVPKDGQTQNMRPVGRLAMVDHGQRITSAINEAIEAAAAASITDNLHVYVVGSISGGTGSGMYIDVVHQLRHLLDQHGLQNVSIVSLLSCPPFGGEDSSRLAYHNTHASLLEINHFLKPENGYPGDVGAGFHSVPAARTPLHDLYLMPGNANSKYGCRPVETIVKYLWNSSHDAAEILRNARSRSTDNSTRPGLPCLRTVGIVSIGRSQSGHQNRLTASLVSELLSDWLGTPKNAKTAAASLSSRISRRSGLTHENVFGSILKTLSSPESAIEIDPSRLNSAPADGSMDYIASSVCSQLHREISLALGDRDHDLSTMITALGGIEDHAQTILTQWKNEIFSNAEGRNSQQAGRLIAIGNYVIAQIVSHCERMVQRLECLAAIIAVAIVEIHRSEPGEDPWCLLPKDMQSCRTDLMKTIHQATVNKFLVRPLNDVNSNLAAAAMTEQLSDAVEPHLVSVLNELVERMDLSGADGPVQSQLKGLATGRSSSKDGSTSGTQSSLSPTILPAESNVPQVAENIEDAMAMVRPPLIDFGGEQRMLLLVPSQAQRLELETVVRAHHSGSISVLVRKGASTTLIQEVQSVPLQGLVTRLEVIGGDSQITSRLSSRIDVEWSSTDMR